MHCGEATAEYNLTTFVVVDVASMWTELLAIRGRPYHCVSDGMEYARRPFPFAIREWRHNGGESSTNS